MPNSVSSSWGRIITWLQSHAAQSLDTLSGPATIQQIDNVSSQLDLQLPEDFYEFYQIFDGAESSGIFPSYDAWNEMAFSPMSLDQIVRTWQMQRQLLDGGDFAGLEVRPDDGVVSEWWNVNWVPFADNGGGDYYCVDVAPTSNGTVGQIISHSHDSPARKVLATSLTNYLAGLADSLEADNCCYDDDYGICAKRSSD